jgi:hypothetical protein
MRKTSIVAARVFLVGLVSAGLVQQASAKGFGGIHVGGLGGLHLGGMHLGGMRMGGMHVGGFHGGGLPTGGFRGGVTSLGGGRGVVAAGGNRGGRGLATGSSFASRYAGGMNLAGARSAGSVASASGKTSQGTFAVRHAVATAPVNSASLAHATASSHGAGNGGSNSGSVYPYNLNPSMGVILPRRYPSFGFPFWGLGPWYYRYGSYGYGGNCYSYCGYYGLPLNNSTVNPATATSPASTPATGPVTNGAGVDFAALGETDFRAGNYETAVGDWRHALLDDATNPVVVLLLGQALFATGKYDEAAGAVQHAMRLLPEDQWGVVVSHYTELYRSNQDYTDQLRALEAARAKTDGDSAAVHFLLGYHYGYLGYPKDAVRELQKTLTAVSQDSLADRLSKIMAAKLAPVQAPAPAN